MNEIYAVFSFIFNLPTNGFWRKNLNLTLSQSKKPWVFYYIQIIHTETLYDSHVYSKNNIILYFSNIYIFFTKSYIVLL